ncbi:polyisoprenyl-teichoic acid--peptidoglycan teichoic acid transferase TagU [Niallia endozanthoxylica]|uniref:Polyisoprenyl-teichoic acid--peptidoglycan teichoic acid transferase TagU n=1 Tax=Niallia endozanthoxylica TaxID=2036016 RepID=A0A5J5H4E7_9BACI|nr:LytR family transcriptional regulator [Niallia endozanthoxylica]KAA9015525.1 LytR family transcriptional regulator [Niallia endozanthoxylica]
MKAKKKRKKGKLWLKVIGILFFLFVAFGGVYAYTVYQSLTTAVDTMHQPIEREKSEKRPEVITLTKKEDPDPFSILLLGVDERQGDSGRSDTMIVLTVNPEMNSIKMLSIPRDTRTEIVGRGAADKINHAYAFGREEMSIATVEHLLDIPIDYFVKVNMEGFKEIVDAVGGIQVMNTLDFSEEGQHFSKGQIHLNGEQALPYVRMRKEDPNGDFGRQERQRQVIQGIITKGASFGSLTRFNEIFEALGKNVRTNLTFDEMLDIQKNYKTAASSVEQLQMTGQTEKIGGIYYVIVPDAEIQKVQTELKTHLEMNKTGQSPAPVPTGG